MSVISVLRCYSSILLFVLKLCSCYFPTVQVPFCWAVSSKVQRNIWGALFQNALSALPTRKWACNANAKCDYCFSKRAFHIWINAYNCTYLRRDLFQSMISGLGIAIATFSFNFGMHIKILDSIVFSSSAVTGSGKLNKYSLQYRKVC